MTKPLNWQPSASIETLKARAKLINRVRQYFADTNALEVETPVLSQFSGTDVQLMQWQTQEGLSLHTSPEFAMKRLLAAGAGDIYQVCHVFRKDESGKKHNPEFSMLEWYRVGIDEFELMGDIVSLIKYVAARDSLSVETLTYQSVFDLAGLPDPHRASLSALRETVSDRLNADARDWSRDDCLNALMSLIVEPSLDKDKLIFVHQFPASQAALAEHEQMGEVTVARRFELFWQGMELANGYFELTNEQEQKRRFDADIEQRAELGLDEPRLDQRFLAALKAGMPNCSGVALGLDRLMMILLQKSTIEEVMAFSFDRA